MTHENSDEAVSTRDAQPPFVLAVDVGTSSVRAALYDGAAREVAGTQERRARGFCTTADGGAEVDSQEAVADVLRVMSESLASVPAWLSSRIESVAVCCFWHSLVGVDASGRALTPVYGWADTRAAGQVEILQASFDERQTHARTGCRFHASYWPAKLLWLRQERSDTFRSVARWMSFGELLTLRLCGVLKASVSMASGTGLFDQRACAWDAPLVEFLTLRPEQLPPLADDGESFALSDAVAARLSLPARARVFPAVGDGAANNIGEGCATRESAALMVGTSAAMRVVYEGDAPEAFDTALWLYRIDRRRVCVGGALSDGGGLFDWMKRTLAPDATTDALTKSVEEFEPTIAALAPDAHGLTLLPFWAGERSTGWHALASGAILGLTSHTRPADIVRAAMEAVAYRIALVALALEAHAPRAELRASGGALRGSRAWTQIIADALGRPMHLSRVGEASSRGAALLALEAMGAIKSVGDVETPTGETVEPNAAHHEIYARGLERQQKIYDLLIGDQPVARLLDRVGEPAMGDDASRCEE